ncbi:MAG TPA: ATP-dependent Clp protease ATP-binding subunit [Candidatus Eisenbacteria bacterium]|nr:ATP-dependent Clp protease ATP-binding subunit [Candidatus Eisenbacteria bacterium]
MTPAARELIVCSRCSGSGYEGHRQCPLCRGFGAGMMHGDRFLYWGLRIDGFVIFLRKLKGVVDAIINVLLVLAFFGGALYMWQHVSAAEPATVLTLGFWHAPHPSLLAFWAGVVCLSMWYYRHVMSMEKREHVRLRAYGETLAPAALPSEPGRWEFVRKLPRKSRIDVSRAFSAQSLVAVEQAYSLARTFKSKELATTHLFASLLSTQKVAIVFGRLGLQFEKYRDKLARMLGSLPKDDVGTTVSPSLRGALLDAYIEAYEERQPSVDVTEVFMAVVRKDERVAELLIDLGVDVQKAENVVQWIRIQDLLRQRYRRFSSAARLKPKDAMNRSMTAVATPFLDRISTDLTRLAAFGHIAPVIGREAEFEALFRVIEGGGRSVVLVGFPGVGKDAIIEGIAQRMVEEDVPKILQDKRLISLNVAQLVSGATASEAQERLLAALYEVARAGNIVLVVPEVAGMVGISAGSGESIDLSRVFATELSRGYFFAITTASPQSYRAAIEGTPLGQALTKVEVPEMGVNDAIQVLEAKSGAIEYKNDVFFSYAAIEAAVVLSARYMHEQMLPEKAIQVAMEAALAVRNAKGKNTIMTREDVAAVLAEKTHIPLKQMTQEEGQKLLTLETRMHERMIGQEDAVKAVASAMRRARAELKDQSRPIANFLFLGPTGVGKTELAKTLAEEYFGNEGAMIRLDMSEYQDKSSIYKLIGEPAGAQSGGLLTEAIRQKPFSLLLLDELEKAHPDILTVFLQVMDDGRLTDNVGRTIDFTNVILIATSNAGAQFIQEAMRQNMATEAIHERLLSQELKGIFRPEFLNRFDGVIVFKPLTQPQIVQIARLMLAKISKRLESKGIVFEATEDAIEELAAAGYDPLFGARPLRRVLQDRVDNAIADALLRGGLGRRDKLIYEKGGTLRVEKAAGL